MNVLSGCVPITGTCPPNGIMSFVSNTDIGISLDSTILPDFLVTQSNLFLVLDIEKFLVPLPICEEIAISVKSAFTKIVI